MEKKRASKKILLIVVLSVVLVIPLVIFPVTSVAVYEGIFSARYETAPWMTFSVSDFEGLQVERSDFWSDGVMLAGYAYAKEGQVPHGVVVVAHGLGGGGHNFYMPFIDAFTEMGYLVFAYDARGNDRSGGDVEGLPQALIDLDHALDHVGSLDAYRELPMMLFGHSWGGYAVGNVLNLHPEVKAAVIVAGFNESEDLLAHYGKEMAGKASLVMMPYLELYERLKFGGEYTDLTAIEGMEGSNASVMIVQSQNDATVPTTYGYDKFYDAFGDDERFEFVLYEDRGHDYLFFSADAWVYREQLNEDYRRYVEEGGRKYSATVKKEFMNAYLDKKKCFEPDPDLMEQIQSLFDRCSGDAAR